MRGGNARSGAAVTNPDLPRATVSRFMGGVLISTVVVIPLLLDPYGSDAFRQPKELLFRAAAILLAAVMAYGTATGKLSWRRFSRHRVIAGLLIAGILWTGLTTMASTNVPLSIESAATVLAAAIFFAASYLAADTLQVRALYAVIIPGVVNAATLFLQAFSIWNPVDPDGRRASEFGMRYVLTGLLGNADDAGAFAVFALIAAVVVAAVSAGRERMVAVMTAVLLGASMVIAGSFTAFIAAGAALVLIAGRCARRVQLMALIPIAVVLIGATVLFNEPARQRLTVLRDEIAARRFDSALSGRLIAYASAAQMLRDHPLLGVGPGTFKFHYFDYKIAVERRFPNIRHDGARSVNFGEAHNDHLQIAAETGFPGYLFFFLASVSVVALTFKRQAPGQRSRAAQLLASAAVVALMIEGLAFFPLQIAACRSVALFIIGISCSWLD